MPWKQKEAEFKNNGLIYLVKDLSRQHSLQATAWLQLATCSKVYNQKSDQKWDRKIWRMCSLVKKGAEECLKFGLSKVTTYVKEGSVTKEKSSLHTRAVSKVSLEQDLTYWRLQGIKIQNRLKGELLSRESSKDTLLQHSTLWLTLTSECFSCFICPGTRHPEAAALWPRGC